MAVRGAAAHMGTDPNHGPTMTLTTPIPTWIATLPAPTLTTRPADGVTVTIANGRAPPGRRRLTEGAALGLLGEVNGFAAAVGILGHRARTR